MKKKELHMMSPKEMEAMMNRGKMMAEKGQHMMDEGKAMMQKARKGKK